MRCIWIRGEHGVKKCIPTYFGWLMITSIRCNLAKALTYANIINQHALHLNGKHSFVTNQRVTVIFEQDSSKRMKYLIYIYRFPKHITFWDVYRLTLKSTMPWLWNAHLARDWTRRLDIFFPSALHFARQIHNSFSRLSTICLRCCIICTFIQYNK